MNTEAFEFIRGGFYPQNVEEFEDGYMRVKSTIWKNYEVYVKKDSVSDIFVVVSTKRTYGIKVNGVDVTDKLKDFVPYIASTYHRIPFRLEEVLLMMPEINSSQKKWDFFVSTFSKETKEFQ